MKKECCSKCEFPLDMERDIILLDNNVLGYLEYENNTCEECGHQKDGITIKSVKKTFDDAIRKKIDERDRLIKFIHHFQFLTKEQREEVCLMLPRFCKPNYKSVGNPDEDDLEEPYSWNVVYIEVINDTQLSRTMLNNINWDEIKDEN